MTQAEKGRFCASCQKQVIDFTGMSDAQLAVFFKKPSTGSVCGRFYQDQLDHDIEIPRKRIPWVKYFFQFALPAFLISIKASAQKKTVDSKVEITQTRTNSLIIGDTTFYETTLSLSKQTSLKGRVINEYNEPVPFASIIVKGMQGMGLSADSNGVFSIAKLPFQNELTLEISSVGYETKSLTISKETDLSNELMIQLRSPIMENVEVVVVGRQIVLGGLGIRSVCIKGAAIRKTDSTAIKTSEQAPEKINAIKLYPNPVARSNSVHIEFNSKADEMLELLITGMNGSIVLQRKERMIKGFNRISVTADARWAAGIYILRLTNEKGSLVKQEKIVVQ